MTKDQETEQAPLEDNLMTSEEQAVCKQISTGEAPHSQRALALLALSEGSTQAQAAEQSGLTLGQVKYWVTRFKKQRLGVFPDALLDELNTETEVEGVTEIEQEDESVTEKKDTKSKKAKKNKTSKKDKKSKKEKKSKAGKKDKKSKKTKKDKKSKKAKKSKSSNKGKKASK